MVRSLVVLNQNMEESVAQKLDSSKAESKSSTATWNESIVFLYNGFFLFLRFMKEDRTFKKRRGHFKTRMEFLKVLQKTSRLFFKW